MFDIYKPSQGVTVPFCTEENAHVLVGQELFCIDARVAKVLAMLPASSAAIRRALSHTRLSRQDIAEALVELQQANVIEKDALTHHVRATYRNLRRYHKMRFLRVLQSRCALIGLALRCHWLRWRLGHSGPEAVSNKRDDTKRILVIAYGGIGDMVLATPLLRSLHDANPEAEIDILVRAKNAAIYRQCPFINRTISFCGEKPMFRCRGGASENARDLYRGQYSAVITYMEHFGGAYRWFTGKAVAYITGAHTRIGTLDWLTKSLPRMADHFLTHAVPFRREHEVVRGYRLLRRLGIRTRPGPLEVWCGVREKEQAQRIVARYRGTAATKIVGVAPFTTRHKMWPLDYWAQLLERLLGNPDCAVILLGGNKDIGASAILNNFCRNRLVNMVGQTTLPLFCALVGQLDLLLSVDTGAAHIAAAHRIPQVVLFGPVSPKKYGPWQNPRARVLRAPGGSMKNLAVEDVYCTIHKL